MAAVTVEDCLKIIPNRFELSLIASYRAKQLINGAPMLYTPKKPEKNTVIALREIAAGLLDLDLLREEIKNNIKNQSLFKNTDEELDFQTKKNLESDLESGIMNDNLDDLEEVDDLDETEEDLDDYSDLNLDSSSEDLDEDLEK